MTKVPYFKIDLFTLQGLVTDRLRTLVEFLMANGANELEAINFILDMAEFLLDEVPPTSSEIEEIRHASS